MSSIRSRIVRRILSLVKGRSYWEIPLDDLRHKIDQSAHLLSLPPGVQVQPVSSGTFQAEWLVPAGAFPHQALLYFHGGGYVVCSLQSHRPLVARIAQYSGIRAFSVDYRLAPEHPYPAALEDALAAYHWLVEQGYPPQDIILGGDSAGGNLVLVTMLALRRAGEELPAAGVCISPLTDMAGTGDSIRSRAAIDPYLTTGVGQLLEFYAPGGNPFDPMLSPLYADLAGFPPLLIQVGTDEILYDDAVRMAEKARLAGVDVRLEVYPGMWHVFQAFTPLVPEAGLAIQKIGDFIREIFQASR